MALDTAAKRVSAIGVALGLTLVLPLPDGSLDQGDRQDVAYSYAGILAGALVPARHLNVCQGTVRSINSIRSVASLNPTRSVNVHCDV